jgi:NOL1/NOP2/fmu family ribosome biogenesis protein
MTQGVSLSQKSSRIRNIFEPLDRSGIIKMWQHRFDMDDSTFEHLRFYKKGPSVWATNDLDLPRLSYEAIGMRIMNIKDEPWKPTTAALRVFGKNARKNFIVLEKDDAMAFLEGGVIRVKAEEDDDDAPSTNPCGINQCLSNSHTSSCLLEPGYVVVFYRGDVLGCGLYSFRKLASQIPKELRNNPG